jgi:hypothetical protein
VVARDEFCNEAWWARDLGRRLMAAGAEEL